MWVVQLAQRGHLLDERRVRVQAEELDVVPAKEQRLRAVVEGHAEEAARRAALNEAVEVDAIPGDDAIFVVVRLAGAAGFHDSGTSHPLPHAPIVLVARCDREALRAARLHGQLARLRLRLLLLLALLAPAEDEKAAAADAER